MRERPILPAAHAALNAERAGRPYQPSNGTEGEFFFEAWCRGCARDRAMRDDIKECDDDEGCNLIARSMAFKPGDAEYPAEWQYDKAGQPCCTAFVPAGEPIPTPPCLHTMALPLGGDTDKKEM
ncbi:hypothetical protein [Bordetella hinzii]|uniref:hypothetical protein n=1 Tax=Bordetella hinzii TaxID=103855 RepID=UPI0011529F23|nr:hypothetical protein [Bordetella hinzii]QDJ52843.1 hypothetical protein CBR69_22240 [Bordetella hinzii]